MISFNILESEDSYEDLESIISIFASLILSYSFCLIYLPLIIYCVANLNYIARCFFRLNLFSYLHTYLIIYLFLGSFTVCIFFFFY